MSEILNDSFKRAVDEEVQKAVSVYKEENEAILKTIDLRLKRIDRERKQFEEEKQEQEGYYNECNKSLNIRARAIEVAVRDSSEEKLVYLNVGGHKVTTLKSTISRVGPYFANLFSDIWRKSGNETITDKDGYIFIDRSGKYFDHLLNWSRNGNDPSSLIFIKNHIKKHDDKGYKTFMSSLEYYGIDTEEDFDLKKLQKLPIYWRGDRKIFIGTIINIELNGQIIQVKYDDGDIWEYKVSSLSKKTGVYKSHFQIGFDWWHYGSARQISKNPKPT